MTLATYVPASSVVDVEFLLTSILTLRQGYEPWIKDMVELRNIESARPMSYSGTELVSQVDATQLEHAQTRYTEFVSGRLRMLRQNYVGRMIDGECKIEAQRISGDRVEQLRREALLSVCNAILYQLDYEIARLGMGTSWRRLVAESSAFPGKIIIFPWLRKGKDGRAKITAEIWDPLTVYHDFNTWPRRIIRERRTGAMDAHKWLLEQYVEGQPAFDMPIDLRINKADQPVTISDIWVEEPNPRWGDPGEDEFNVWRAIFFDMKFCGKVLTAFDHLPPVISSTHATVNSYQVATAGGIAAVDGLPQNRGVQREAILNHAQPFYASLKHTHEQFKVLVSTAFEGLAQGLNPALHISSLKGDKDIPEAQLVAGGRSFTTEDVKITAINRGVAEVSAIAKLMTEMFDKEYNIVYDDSLLGQHSGPSGFSDLIRTNHARTVLNEPAAACSVAVLNTIIEIIHQWQRNPTLEIRGTQQAKGVTIGRQMWAAKAAYHVDDLPDDLMLDCHWEADLGDLMQKISAAQQYIALGFPISYVWAKVFGITNAQELQEMADLDAVRQSAPVQNANVLQYFLEKWLEAQDNQKHAQNPQRKQMLQVIADYYKRLYETTEASMNPQQTQGTPAGAPGIPPGALPPEATPNNPDMLAAAQGKQSSAAGGQGAVGVLGEGGGTIPAPRRPAVVIRNGKPIVQSIGGVMQ